MGFTLIELMVSIVIITLLAALWMRSFTYWSKRSGIESDVNNIQTFLQHKRLQAFAEKRTLRIALRNNGTQVCESTDNTCIELKNPFMASGNITITDRGTFSTGYFRLSGGTQVNPSFSCVSVSSTRARIGIWSGGVCDEK